MQGECDDTEKQLTFRILLDDHPEQTAWNLICDTNDIVWQVDADWDKEDDANTWVTNTACIGAEQQCIFTLLDTAGDGLGENGWYALVYGAQTIATSPNGQAKPFLEQTFCVGMDCPEPEDAMDDTETLEPDGECSDDQDLVTWRIRLDDHPRQTGWTLVCDGQMEWNVPPRSLSEPHSWVVQTLCVASDVSLCTLTLTDTAGDGLDEQGWYSLTVGATTIDYGQNHPFSELSLCFGQECEQPPVENDNDDSESTATLEPEMPECDVDSTEVTWEIMVDENPREIGWQMVCDGVLHWNVPVYSLSIPNNSITQHLCIKNDASTCHLTLVDSAGDGLSPVGWYSLQFGDQVIAASPRDGKATPFSELSFCLGKACDQESLGGDHGTETDQADETNELEDEPDVVSGEDPNDEGNVGVEIDKSSTDDYSDNKPMLIAILVVVGLAIMALTVLCLLGHRRLAVSLQSKHQEP